MGSPSSVEPTAQERAQADIHLQQWEQYQESGIPLENEWVARTTGYRFNSETGDYEIDPNGILNADGTVKIDTTTAESANEQAYGRALNQANPNRLEQAEQLNREGSIQGANSQSEMALGQQRNARLGLVNAVARGKGLEGEALQHQSQLTAQAQQDAISSAEESASRSSTTGYLLGAGAGLAGVTLANRERSGLDSYDPIEPKKPGDQHPS